MQLLRPLPARILADGASSLPEPANGDLPPPTPGGRARGKATPLIVFDGGHLSAVMHEVGINLRYLPAVSARKEGDLKCSRTEYMAKYRPAGC